MPYVFKTNELDGPPDKGSTYLLTSRYSSVQSGIQQGETVYVFVEDRTPLGRYGGLVGRGTIRSARDEGGETRLEIVFDCTAISVPLETRSLRRFAHPHQYSLPELEREPIALMRSLLAELGEVRRKTTKQPIHEISQDAADWLNLYHFEKEKN